MTGRPPGRRFPIAPASSAPRSPARRGIHANFAPDDCASATAAEIAPALSESLSPTRITDLPVSPDILEIDPASFPADVEINSALSFLLPRDANGATVVTFIERLRTCL